MCFSASASFAVSAALLAGGIGTIKYVRTPSQIPFAIIPIIFSIQQFTEGFVWLSFTNTAYQSWNQIATHTFLLFAQVAWPVWVPFSILLLEKDEKRKRILWVLLWIGIAVSAYLMYCILFYNTHSSVSEHHIKYGLDFPHEVLPFTGIFYFIPTVIPAFLSSVRKMIIIGITILISFIITKIFFGEYVISIWCFFAAAISITVFLIMAALQKPVTAIPKIKAQGAV